MAAHNDLGKKGEEIAVQYMLDKGLELLHTNWRCYHYEIDAVFKEGDRIIFAEVCQQ